MSRVENEPRISQILPTVKCSDCGRDVHIHRLGDHLCSSMPPVPALPILPDKYKALPPKSKSPLTPLQSPGEYDLKTSGPIPSPYYSPTRDLRRPSINDEERSPFSSYRDDTRKPYGSHYDEDDDGFYDRSYPPSRRPQTPNSLNPSTQYPRKNSTSPAPSDSRFDDYAPSSPLRNSPGRTYFSSNRDFQPRKDSLGNATKPKTDALDTLMADLMVSMNEEDYISPRPMDHECAACGEEFDYRDDVTKAGQKCYHKSCFVCRLCRVPLDPRRGSYHEHQGKLYCEADYNVVTHRVSCASCDRPILPNTVPLKALGKVYHPGHLQCSHCLEPVLEDGFKEHRGRVYCRSDFKKLFLPKCRGCHLPVEKEAVSAMDGKLQGKWHLECFGCHTCRQPFPDNTFYVFDNAPYCKRHYHQLNNSLCRTCDEPIEGPCAQTIEGWRFHPACFRCYVCRCAISDIYYMFERHIYCEVHIRQLQQRQHNIRAEKRRTQFGQI
ncbi:uncharacterized protein BYT42DRAFT_566804 [Radiomyces spectabilis]|uniref:uncharacterized protein n=1 Tax=Radiomyces spectabilis TaxID=64574 RepID=UPI00221EC7B8|nr:uncharacterized protein BYT42DRAFT_566804 [Radiomyces spectabilis]KAI8381515.1 hypothetical protein BYT42DRAFT_566804 [Radiomyces spectabilis]